MPALNFQKQFAEAVERGEKCQTIRALRKDGRDPKPGDTLYLYTGMRTKACRKLREVRCVDVRHVLIEERRIYRSDDLINESKWSALTRSGSEAIARRDGFSGFAEMRAWFEKVHGLPFEGLLIRWAANAIRARGKAEETPR